MRNLNLSRRSLASSIALRILTALVIVLAPAAAYAAKGPCVSQSTGVSDPTPGCVNGRYDGPKVERYAKYVCAGTSENDDCTPDAVTDKVIAITYQYSTIQSSEQKDEQNQEAAWIAQSLTDCTAWANSLSQGGAIVTTAAGVVTLASFLFPGIGTVVGVVSAVVTVAAGVATYSANATIQGCNAKNAEQVLAHQQRRDNCVFVSQHETEISVQTANSCQ